MPREATFERRYARKIKSIRIQELFGMLLSGALSAVGENKMSANF
jgi:hypothetical protein